MIPLDSARWAELGQSFGTAEDIPRLLVALRDSTDERERTELWFGVWATLCPDDAVQQAAYAAVPHLLTITLKLPTSEQARALHFVAQVEVLRAEKKAPTIPVDLLAPYATAVESMPAMVAHCALDPWTTDVAQTMGAALLAGKRQPALARLLLDAGSSVE